MYKTLVGIVALALIGGGAYYWYSQNEMGTNDMDDAEVNGMIVDYTHEDESDTTADTSTDTASAETVTIRYTDSGFSPSVVTVKKGTEVVFKNESSRAFWPASAVHPTHSNYPEKSSADCLGSAFDACTGISAGESYSFVFNEVGEWGFHDHLRASNTGKVIVHE